jgi:ATP-binding cassette, subfamily C, bacteriocin exporter
MFHRFYCVKQYDITDCGAACLATISKQYGLKMPVTKIREIAGTDKQGTSAYGLIKAAEKLGFTAKGVKGNNEAFFTKFPLPCVAHVVVDGSLLHYVVIHKITKKQVIIADPAKGIVKKTPEEFFKEWTGVLIFMVPDVNFQKGNENKGTFTRFLYLLKPQKTLLANIFVASLLYTVLGILASFYFQLLMDDILPNSLYKTLTIISIGIIVLYLFKTLLNAFRSQLMLYLGQRIDIPLILGFYQHLMKLPMNFFGTRKIGEIISRFNDASKIRDTISSATLTIMIDTLMAIAGGVILCVQNAPLFGITAIILALYGIIVFSFNRPVKKINEKVMEENAQLTSYLVESLEGIETVKSFTAERHANLKTENKFIRLLKSVFKSGTIGNVEYSLTDGIGSIGGVVILWVGAVFVLNGNLSIGRLLTFNALLAYFLDPVKNLIGLQTQMQSAIVASDRLGQILDLAPETGGDEDKKLKPPSLKGDIKFENVDFRYGTRRPVLQGINIEIKQGEKIALVGESGSGKTTLAKLMMNFYTPEKGEITMNENNIKDINKESLRGNIAYISQDIFLFSGTIRENMLLGNPGATLDDVIEACKMSHAHDFINSLPLRYETMLEENGANLSGGQKQRLAIARALLKHPDILIMDEATSNLDSITEKAIEKTINKLTDGITTVIIAHRLSTIMRCNRIYVLDKGRVIETGTHKELVEKQGYYYNLWKEQLPQEVVQAADEAAISMPV